MPQRFLDDLARDEVVGGFPRIDGYPQVGKYLVTQRLGRGGMGVVYRVFHSRLRQERAMKFVLPEHTSETSVQAFLREAEKAARVQHPNVVQIHDVDEDQKLNRVYLVMELVRGETLHERVQRKGPLAFDEALAIIAQAADGLGAIHEAGLVHRDIKPANIMINRDGVVKVNDFGLARSFDGSRLSGTHTAAEGTPVYMSPEHFLQPERVTPAADIWALGLTLWFLLTGSHAFAAENIALIGFKVCRDPLPSIGDFRKDIPPIVDEILKKTTNKNPEEREFTARQLGQFIRNYLAVLTPPTLVDARSGEGTKREEEVSPPPNETLSRLYSSKEDDRKEDLIQDDRIDGDAERRPSPPSVVHLGFRILLLAAVITPVFAFELSETQLVRLAPGWMFLLAFSFYEFLGTVNSSWDSAAPEETLLKFLLRKTKSLGVLGALLSIVLAWPTALVRVQNPLALAVLGGVYWFVLISIFLTQIFPSL